MKLECKTEDNESSTLKVHQSVETYNVFDYDERNPSDCIELDNLSKLVNDSWVKLDTNNMSTMPKSEQTIETFQEITKLQKVLL